MKNTRPLAMLLLLTLISALNVLKCSSGEADKPAETPQPAPQPAPVSKWSPRDVEIQLTDSSMFRGELSGVDSIVLKTAYGTLTIPCTEILRIQRGSRLDEKEVKNLEGLIKDLDSEEFAKRTNAQKKLEAGVVAAIEPLRKAREAASAEARSRIDKIVAKLSEKLQGKQVQVEDIVRTTRFEAAGILELKTLKLSSRVGQLTVNVDDLNSVRWLNRGESKLIALEPNASIGNWIDTGVVTNSGDSVAVVATGFINPSPNNNNVEIGPIGTENWGNNNGFLMGTLLGKIGNDGEPFVIGQGKAWTAAGKEHLFVKIFWNNRQCRVDSTAKGSFKVRITTGVLAESVRVPKGNADEEGGVNLEAIPQIRPID